MMEDRYKQHFVEAKKKVRRIKIFYIHLLGYAVLTAFVLYNFSIIKDGPYKNNIIVLNLGVLFAWTVFIIMHVVAVFKGKSIFKRSWEERKIKEYIEEEETEAKFWE